MTKRHNYILGCAVGNLLEWYDFILFGFLASLLAKLFFPNQSEFLSLLLTFMVFASGCIVRPVASIFFGHFGDRFGRKKALIFSILLITIATTLMGILPTYQTAGVWAPILLVICRMIQGVAVSGEEIGAAILLAENAPPSQQGWVGSIILSSVYAGLCLGALTILIIRLLSSPEFFNEWGWRIPFLLSSVVGIFALYIRVKSFESREFEQLTMEGRVLSFPLKILLKNYWRQLLRSVGLSAVLAVGIYLFAVYLPTYFISIAHFSSLTSLIISVVFLFIIAVCSPFFGRMADKYGVQRFMKIGCVSFLICSYPIFYLMSCNTILAAIVAEFMLIVCLAFIAGSILALIVNLFPPEVRYSGACIGFNVSMTVFGSTAPIAALTLQKVFHDQSAPFMYLFFAAALSLLALRPASLQLLTLPVKYLSKCLAKEVWR